MAVDGPRDQGLAGAALAAYEHGGLGVGHGVDHVEYLQHAVIAADDVFHAETEVELGLQRSVLFDDPLLVEGPLHGQQQFFVDQRLGQEVEGPQPNGVDCGLHRAVAGDHDDVGGGPDLAAMRQQIETVVGPQANVGQHQVVGLPLDGREALGKAGGGIDGVALIAKPVGHRGQQVAVVVDQQQRTELFHNEHPGEKWTGAFRVQHRAATEGRSGRSGKRRLSSFPSEGPRSVTIVPAATAGVCRMQKIHTVVEYLRYRADKVKTGMLRDEGGGRRDKG